MTFIDYSRRPEFAIRRSVNEFARLYAEQRGSGTVGLLIDILRGQRIFVPEDARERISECTDREQLELWVQRALTATTIDEVFEPRASTVEPEFVVRRPGEMEAMDLTEGFVMAVLEFLRMRGIGVPEDVHMRFHKCENHEQLQRWAVRAVNADSLDDLFLDDDDLQ